MTNDEKMSSNEIAKTYLRVLLISNDEKSIFENFDINRNDGYKSDIDAGYEDLNLKEDMAKLMLYMLNDTILFNNGKVYKVIKREFQPCRPVLLCLTVEQIN